MKVRPVEHACYLSWAGRACSVANSAAGEKFLNRWSFDLHLFRWAVREGLIEEPEELDRPLSVFVARAFSKDPEAVKAEARRLWRRKLKAMA